MSKEAKEFLSTVYEIHPSEIIYSIVEGKNDGEYVSEIMEAYHQAKSEPSVEAVKYMVSVWDEAQGNWRERPDHVQQMFLKALKK